MTRERLDGSGTIPRIFAALALAAVTVFLGAWLAGGAPLPAILVIEAVPVALLVRSLFLGVFLEPDAVRIRSWTRTFRYRRGDLRAVAAVPYWRFLDRERPALALLKLTPESGWVREPSGTVAWRGGAARHAAAIRAHLGIDAGD